MDDKERTAGREMRGLIKIRLLFLHENGRPVKHGKPPLPHAVTSDRGGGETCARDEAANNRYATLGRSGNSGGPGCGVAKSPASLRSPDDMTNKLVCYNTAYLSLSAAPFPSIVRVSAVCVPCRLAHTTDYTTDVA